MIIVIMGAAGSGKSTVGRQLSEQLQWVFLDGDAVHPPENIAKMARGTLLNDEDRRPWLQALRRRSRSGRHAIPMRCWPVLSSSKHTATPSWEAMSHRSNWSISKPRVHSCRYV